MAILELKYQYAKDAGMAIICDRLAKKASRILERIQKARAFIAVDFRRDWAEAIEMNLLVDLRNHPERFLPMVIKENANAANIGSDNRPHLEGDNESGKQLAG